jgi:hypothetical protein
MNKLLPGITLKTIICCLAVSSIISYGSCAFYLSFKTNAAKLFPQEKVQHFERHLTSGLDNSIAIR